MTRTTLAMVISLSLAGCAERAPEQQWLEDVAEALGGRQAIESATTLTLQVEGTLGNLGQDMTPEATAQSFSVKAERRSDLTSPRTRTDRTRTPQFNYFRGPAPMTQVTGVDGDVAYDVGDDGSARRASAHEARERLASHYQHPLTIVRAAMQEGASVADAGESEGRRLFDVTTADGVTVTVAVDPESNLPTWVGHRALHPNLRDVMERVEFSDYEESDGLMLPTRIVVWIDDHETQDVRVTSQSVNADVGDLAAPSSASSSEPPAAPTPNVVDENVADGIWLLAGESHHSVLVEFSDHLMIIEAPNEARTLAVIAKARELVPDKPVTQLVSSHHHFDHSGGIRAAISEGLTIITQEGNAGFYRDLAQRPSTIEPDALARSPQDLKLETVADQASYEDDTMTVQLFHIAGNPHADTLLMAYFPESSVLVQADAFSPGRDYQPFATNLKEQIEERGLDVERIVPIHGSLMTYDALVSAVAAMAGR